MTSAELYQLIIDFINNPGPHDTAEVEMAYPCLRDMTAIGDPMAKFYLHMIHKNPSIAGFMSIKQPTQIFNASSAMSDSKSSKDCKMLTPAPSDSVQYKFSEDPCFDQPPNWLANRRHSWFVTLHADGRATDYSFYQAANKSGNSAGRFFQVKDNPHHFPHCFVKTPLICNLKKFNEWKKEADFYQQLHTGPVHLIGDEKAWRLVLPMLGDLNLTDELKRANNNVTKLRLLTAAALELWRIHQLGYVHGDVKAENFRVSADGSTAYAVDFACTNKIGVVYQTYQSMQKEEAIRNLAEVIGTSPDTKDSAALNKYVGSKELKVQISSTIKNIQKHSFHVAPERLWGHSCIVKPAQDIFSFGIIIRDNFPDYKKHASLRILVESSTHKEPEKRPSLEEICIALDKALTLEIQSKPQPALRN